MAAAPVLSATAPAVNAPVSPAAQAFFETKVRPVLVEHCYRCHGEKLQSGRLRVDSRAALLTGGGRGPAIVPGAPEQSRLLTAISYDDATLRMPPTGKLPKPAIEALTQWVKMGAPWPTASKVAVNGERIARSAANEVSGKQSGVSSRQETHWAFRPVRRPPFPMVKNRAWAASPIDALLLEKLEAKGLTPNPPATKRELIRRAYFDLLGLPPTPEAVAAFEADPSPQAWERVIDNLLARPQYGERWARHWLDVTRYGQTNGYERDSEKPYAWRYRDYVIKAFNEDRPYDRFIIEQLAGDELDAPTHDSLIATGFYRVGIWDDEPDDKRAAEYEELDDIVSTTGQAFLGLTLGCARCHDHKFDPVSQKNYYQFLAFFHNLRGYEIPHYGADCGIFAPLAPADEVARWRAEQKKLEEALRAKLNASPDSKEKQELNRQLAGLNDRVPPYPLALAARERAESQQTRVLVRGDPATPGDEVQPAFPNVLSRTTTTNCAATKRRLAVAQWIASADNPLTARVFVNRVWQHHFGRPLVPTPNDFGKAGLPPTNPELLDWLASEFMRGDWRLKRLHKIIMMSNAYRMSSRAETAKANAIDEGNDLLWRQNPRRLEAEAIRDAALAVSGRLNLTMEGRGIFPRLSNAVLAGQSRPGNGWENNTPESEQARRSVYIFVKRTLMVPLMEGFDYTNTAQSLSARPTTTVAPQALMLLNGDFFQDQAAAFAERLVKETGTDSPVQVERAYRLALGRAPTESERQIALAHIQRQIEALTKPPSALSADEVRRRALKAFCLVVLNLNEFVYVD